MLNDLLSKLYLLTFTVLIIYLFSSCDCDELWKDWEGAGSLIINNEAFNGNARMISFQDGPLEENGTFNLLIGFDRNGLTTEFFIRGLTMNNSVQELIFDQNLIVKDLSASIQSFGCSKSGPSYYVDDLDDAEDIAQITNINFDTGEIEIAFSLSMILFEGIDPMPDAPRRLEIRNGVASGIIEQL